MEETNNHPQWLLEIENRKRKPRLAHEAGAGAPCMVCNSACPGLDLHFWRKICKICKCSRDDHDVNDDDFPQFDLLFGPSGKFKKKSILLRVPNKKQNEVETSFEWIPPDTTKDLATDYMKALPIEKLPIKGSAGAALRRQLLQKQLPLHDIDHKACDELSEGEKKQFEKYLDNLKRYVGQGKVIKILGARPFDKSLMTPANATDMQKFSPQHKQVSINSMQLKTPSSLAKQIQHMKTTHENEKRDSLMSTDLTSNQADVLEATNERVTLNAASSNVNIPHELINSSVIKQTANSEDVLLLGSSNTCKSLVGKYNKQKPAVPLKYLKEKTMPSKNDNTFQNSLCTADPITEDLSNIQCHDDDTESSYLMHAENILADALLPPSAIHTDDIIGSTLDEQKLIFIREKLNSKYSMQEAVAGRQMPGISQELGGHSNLKSNVLPKVNNMREKINLPEITANKYILKNPELELACTTTLDNILPANASKLSPYKSSSCNPTSITTMRPSKNINLEESPQTSISTTNEDNNSQVLKQDMYQQNQLPLSTLNIDNTNCLPSKLDKLGCIPTSIIYSDQLQNDVLPHEIINEINQVTPNLCNVNHIKDGIKGLALESIKHQTCEKCHEDIRIGDVAVTIEKAQNVSWHPGCFVCSVCNELLGDLIYFYYKNKLYCGRDLSTLLGIPRCFACDELIFVREYTVAEGHNYHVKHFCCWDCDLPLAGQQYISENDRPLCLPCYQNTYAKTCAACEVIIAPNQQGVFIKNLNFHATETCFCCFICKKNLLNGKMAIKENKLFCSKECIGTFLR